jgi:hypothetical protein
MSASASDPQLVAARQYGASASDIAMLADFKQRVAEFQAARRELQKIGAQIARTNDMAAWAEYGKLVERADSIERNVTAVTNAIDSALKSARAALGLEGVRALAGLGIVWVLPVAVIAGAVAIIGYWMADYLKFAKRYSEQQRIVAELVQQGVNPIEAQRQAAEVVAAAAPSMFGNVAGVLKFVAIVGVGFFVWQQYRRRS